MNNHDPIRGVSSDLAKAVLQEVNPEAAAHFDVVKERVFEPHFGDVGMGLPKPLASAAYFLFSLFEALNDQGVQRAISSASRMEEAFQVLIEEVAKRMSRYAHSEETSRIRQGIEGVFAEHPSWVDQTLSAVFKTPGGDIPGSPRTDAGQSDPLEILERCALKVVDSQGRVSTGFVLCPRGHMLTPEHVARGHSSLKVAYRYRTPEGHKREIEGRAQRVYADSDKDFSVFQLDGGTYKRLQDAGLTPPPLAVEWQPRNWVLCLGYQEQEIFADPITVEAFIKPHDPIRAIRFRDGHEQECLVFVIPRDHPSVVPGMSGGPVLNLNTRKVIAMVTGATLEAWVKQRWRSEEIWELISSGIYGFATPLSDVADSWPEFGRCCLQG